MAPKAKLLKEINPVQSTSLGDNSEDFSAELIKQLNKEAGDKIAFNLGDDDAPTNVKRWIGSGSKLLDYCISNRRGGGFPEGRIIEIQGPPSCHAKGDQVLMFDGSIKNIENVVVGDQLMGPDSQPRTVQNLVRGKDELYKVIPGHHGKPHHVSAHHVLPLMKTKESHSGPDFIQLSVKDYMNKNQWFKDSYSLTRTKVEFPPELAKPVVIPPYVLGLLIGDGWLSNLRTELTSADEPIVEEYTRFCKSLGYEVSKHSKKDNLAAGYYHRTGVNTGKAVTPENDQDKIRTELRSLELLDTTSGTKFIPQVYKTRSIQDRLDLLAGLIDTDGYYSAEKNSYEYCSKSLRLAEDVVFIARTSGLKACDPNKKLVNGTIYYRVNISGNIPSRLARKQAIKENMRQQALSHGFILEAIGEGDIYGVTVNNDNLYLMSDTTIQRNCGKSHLAFEAAKATQQMGGVVVYMDTENATSPDNLRDLGINVSKNFIFIQSNCTEDIFKYAESVIIKSRSINKDVPVIIIWDSVAACSPKAELEGEYSDNSIGLQARVLSKGMRKISNVIANQKVIFLIINQQRTKIGVMFGDPCLSPDTKIKIRRKTQHN